MTNKKMMFNKQLDFFRINKKTAHLHHGNLQDHSNGYTTQVIMRFRNGNHLSVIRGYGDDPFGSYGQKRGLLEAAPTYKGAVHAVEPKGWLTVADVVAMAEEVASDE